MTLQAVQPEDDGTEQLEFHGLPVKEQKYTLKKVNGLYTDKPLDQKAMVKGTFEGHVTGFKYDYEAGAWTWAIEVTYAELG